MDIANTKLKKIDRIFKSVSLYDFDKVICNEEPCNLYNKKEDLIFFTDNTYLTVKIYKIIFQNFKQWFKLNYEN